MIHDDTPTRGERRERRQRKRRYAMVIDGQATKTVLAPLAQRRPPRRRKPRRR